MNATLQIDRDKLADFCRRWKITELSLFGSVLREDFRPDSDVDVLVTFAAGAPWSLLDLVTMEEELRQMFRREVHLVEQAGLRNPFRQLAPSATGQGRQQAAACAAGPELCREPASQ
jgi:predicted nucleotidyltransferase